MSPVMPDWPSCRPMDACNFRLRLRRRLTGSPKMMDTPARFPQRESRRCGSETESDFCGVQRILTLSGSEVGEALGTEEFLELGGGDEAVFEHEFGHSLPCGESFLGDGGGRGVAKVGIQGGYQAD